VGKHRDREYMDLGYLGFVNNVGVKKRWMPQPSATWVVLLGKKEGHQGW
jgi:hypothetical protein